MAKMLRQLHLHVCLILEVLSTFDSVLSQSVEDTVLNTAELE